MSDRYTELYRIQPRQYIEGCPVIIEAGALLKDNVLNKVLVQLKLRNICNREVKACKVSIRAYEANGNELEGVNDFSYLDINVCVGNEFGSKTPIYLPKTITRIFKPCITEIVFNNGDVWSGKIVDCEIIQESEKICNVINDAEMQKQYILDIGEGKSCQYVPQIYKKCFFALVVQ